MEPFTITCTSCASRVRVRNPDLLGQLVNCPKCNSMILIALPDNSSPRAAASKADTADGKLARVEPGMQGEPRIEVERHRGPSVDSTALTQEGLPADLVGGAADNSSPNGELGNANETEGGASSHISDSASPHGEDAEYRLAPDPFETDSAVVAPPVQPVGPLVGSGASPTWNAEGPAHLPSADWTSDSTTKTRQMLLVGFLGFAGVMLAVLLFIGFLRWYTKDNTTASDSDLGAADPAAGNEVVGNPPAVEPLDTAPTADNPDEGVTDDSDINGDASPDERLHSSTNDNALPTQADSTTVVGTTEAASDVSPTADSTADSNLAGGDETAQAGTTLELPKRLEAFGGILQFEIQPQFSDATEILTEAPVTAEDLGLTTSVDAIEMPPIDLAAQSKVTVPALVMRELPLSQFVSLWSNLSGIPTGINLDSLAAAGIDRNQNLGLAMVQSATFGSLIEQLGAPLGLQAVARDNRFLELVAPSVAIEQKLPAAISLAGIVAPGAEGWLIESLPQLFPEHSVAWKIEDGKLLRPQTESGEALEPLAWFATVRLLEGWRQAAGLPATLPAYAPALLSASLVAPSDVAGLDFVLQQVQPEARPLAQVIPHICRQAGLQAWVDWPAVASIGIGPQTTGLVLTSQRPLRRALADYVSEFSMIVAVLDKQTLWLTTNQAYRHAPQLYVIPSNGESADEWKSRLRPLTPAAVGELGVGAVKAIATPNGEFILVRCCPMQVDFQ